MTKRKQPDLQQIARTLYEMPNDEQFQQRFLQLCAELNAEQLGRVVELADQIHEARMTEHPAGHLRH